MYTRFSTLVFTVIVAAAAVSRPAEAQSVGLGLPKLLTDQTPPPAGYVRDVAAADATFATVASLLQVELASVPVASSSGGFVYRFSPTFGTVERASDSFGPFFTDRFPSFVRSSLNAVELSVAAATRHQGLVSSDLGHASTLEHHDQVGHPNG
jgi:hypothetical protein